MRGIIGYTIRKARLSIPLFQREVAEMAGVTKDIVSKVELGKCKNKETIKKIADSLSIEYLNLFDEDDTREEPIAILEDTSKS